jgi:anti-sigma factor RsiW
MTIPSFRDVELISALLDGQLPQQDVARLQLRIVSDPELTAIYQQLSKSRALLRKLPARCAPRNFTLTPKMAGVKAPTPRVFPLFRFASAFASLLLVLTFAANGLGQLAANAPAAAPAYGMGGGPISENLEAPAASEPRPQSGGGGEEEMPVATEAVALAPAAPILESTPGISQDSAAVPTEESMRSMAAEPTQSMEEMPFAKAGEEGYSQQQTPETPAREAFQTPAWLQLSLLALALLAGGAAWFVNWQANTSFARQRRK